MPLMCIVRVVEIAPVSSLKSVLLSRKVLILEQYALVASPCRLILKSHGVKFQKPFSQMPLHRPEAPCHSPYT